MPPWHIARKPFCVVIYWTIFLRIYLLMLWVYSVLSHGCLLYTLYRWSVTHVRSYFVECRPKITRRYTNITKLEIAKIGKMTLACLYLNLRINRWRYKIWYFCSWSQYNLCRFSCWPRRLMFLSSVVNIKEPCHLRSSGDCVHKPSSELPGVYWLIWGGLKH
jgi:hypothetical protein